MFHDATHVVTWKRATAYLVDSEAVAASHTIDRQPVRASRVAVSLTGSPTGTVTVAGTVDGGATTEVLTYTGTAATRETKKLFTALTGITTSLSGATLLAARAVGTDGSPQTTLYAVKSGHPISIQEAGSSTWKGETQGAGDVGDETAMVAYEEVWTPRIGDRIVSGSDAWEVLSVEGPQGSALRPRHWECRIRRLADKATT